MYLFFLLRYNKCMVYSFLFVCRPCCAWKSYMIILVDSIGCMIFSRSFGCIVSSPPQTKICVHRLQIWQAHTWRNTYKEFGVKYSVYRRKTGIGATRSYYNRTKNSFLLKDGHISAGGIFKVEVNLVYISLWKSV